METLKYTDALDALMYINELSNGLTCYIIPRKGYVEKQALLCVNYGAVDSRFTLDGRLTETPDGIAHFLEHKMFDGEGANVMDEFAALGASANAFTNYLNTAYYFSCVENFEPCLALLLSFTRNLHVTDESVRKEQDIIAQEINMYEDSPFWRMTLNMQDAMYEQCPVKKSIAGSVESIMQIRKEALSQCFEAFYYPGNMALICVGDFERGRVYELAERLAKPKNAGKTGRVYGDEPASVKTRRAEAHMPLARPMFSIGFKDYALGGDIGQRIVRTKLLMDIAAGESSGLFHKLYADGLLDGPFALDYANGPFYGMASFAGTGPDPDAVANALCGELAELTRCGVDPERFEQIKNKHTGRLVRSFNSLDNIACGQADMFAKGFDLFDLMNRYKEAACAHVTERLNQLFGADNRVLSVIWPN